MFNLQLMQVDNTKGTDCAKYSTIHYGELCVILALQCDGSRYALFGKMTKSCPRADPGIWEGAGSTHRGLASSWKVTSRWALKQFNSIWDAYSSYLFVHLAKNVGHQKRRGGRSSGVPDPLMLFLTIRCRVYVIHTPLDRKGKMGMLTSKQVWRECFFLFHIEGKVLPPPINSPKYDIAICLTSVFFSSHTTFSPIKIFTSVVLKLVMISNGWEIGAVLHRRGNVNEVHKSFVLL